MCPLLALHTMQKKCLGIGEEEFGLLETEDEPPPY